MYLHSSTQIHKENLGGQEERYCQQHNSTRRFQHPTVKNGHIFQTKYQQRYWGTEHCLRWNGLNWYIQSLSSQRSKIHILFKCTWNTFKDRPHDRTQNKPQQIKKIEITSSIFSNHKALKLETNLKEKSHKKLKIMEIEYHGIKQWMGEDWH